MFGQHAPVMPDEDTARLALRTADQLRTDIANLECGQEFLVQRVNSLPTASDLWRELITTTITLALFRTHRRLKNAIAAVV
jgi:hypothetical protein